MTRAEQLRAWIDQNKQYARNNRASAQALRRDAAWLEEQAVGYERFVTELETELQKVMKDSLPLTAQEPSDVG